MGVSYRISWPEYRVQHLGDDGTDGPVIGWYPVEVTPSSTEEEDITSFWDEFADFMGDDDSGADTVTDTNANPIRIPDNMMNNIVYGIIAVIAVFCISC